MTDEELMQLLRTMPIRGGISGAKICSIAADRIEELVKERDTAEAKLAKAVEAIKSAEATITLEINPSNYDHDLVCQLNDETTWAVLILRAALAELEGK